MSSRKLAQFPLVCKMFCRPHNRACYRCQSANSASPLTAIRPEFPRKTRSHRGRDCATSPQPFVPRSLVHGRSTARARRTPGWDRQRPPEKEQPAPRAPTTWLLRRSTRRSSDPIDATMLRPPRSRGRSIAESWRGALTRGHHPSFARLSPGRGTGPPGRSCRSATKGGQGRPPAKEQALRLQVRQHGHLRSAQRSAQMPA